MGARENMGREMYRRRGRKLPGIRVLKGQKAGEIWVYRVYKVYMRIQGIQGIHAYTGYTRYHEEPQEVIFLHGIWRHIKEFGIEGQIPRISSPVKLEKRC